MSDKRDNKMIPPKVPKGGNYQLWVILVTIAVIMGVMWFTSNNNQSISINFVYPLIGKQHKLHLLFNWEFARFTIE